MLSETAITTALGKIEDYYNRSTDTMLTQYYSKLALIELCGWVEQSMDEIIRLIETKTTNPENVTYVEKDIIDKNYGFSYRHFRRMLVQSIGIINVEKMENTIDTRILVEFKSTLGNLYALRIENAHTYIKGITHRLAAPSTIKNHLNTIYMGLKEFEKRLRTL